MAIIDILGVQFNTIDLSQAAEDCMSIVERGERGYPVPVNVNIIMQMRTEKAVREYVEGASIIVADGLPLVWLSRLWYRTPLPERVTGVALMEALIERAALEGRPVYFLGATAAVIQVLIERLNKDLPSLKIAGYSDGYFSEEEEPERVTAIAESGANLLFVGMGVPRQEQFIIRNWENLGVNLVLAGGGSFDVISGIKQRTPQAWSRFGFEWLYRLIQDPKRYYRRYLETFPKFLLIATVASLYRIPQRLFLRTPVPSKSQRDLNREQ
jgi:N-acetylglucosaminyldiphosphoundecaprenol N-acetyl-beta-D-mannosaminyltransferase